MAINEIFGTNGDDPLTGTNKRDNIYGRAGNDVIEDRGGNDTVYGQDGNDFLIGGEGDNFLYGGRGNDYIQANGSGANHMFGGAGRDNLSYANFSNGVSIDLRDQTVLGGGADDDTISGFEDAQGSPFQDTLLGSRKSNVFDGGEGADFLIGRGGDDQLAGGSGDDVLNGGSGWDAARYDFDESNGGTQGIRANLITGIVRDTFGDRDKLTGIEEIIGSQFGDLIKGNDDTNVLNGEGGHDVLFGQAGDDVIRGGGGRDWIDGEVGNDVLFGDGGSDSFFFRRGFDKDVLKDFQNNRDTLFLADDLWSGEKSVQKVLNQFGQQSGDDFVLRFGLGDVFTVENATKRQLLNDVEIYVT